MLLSNIFSSGKLSIILFCALPAFSWPYLSILPISVTLVSIIVFYIVQSSQMAARVIINNLLCTVLSILLSCSFSSSAEVEHAL